MPNLMQSGAAWLGAQLKTSAGLSVVVQQGKRTVEGLTGWVGKHDHLVVDAEGFTTSVTSHDWEFVAADLPSGFEFRVGAVITATINGVEEKYEAVPLGKRPAIENKDTSGVMLVVHTNKVG